MITYTCDKCRAEEKGKAHLRMEFRITDRDRILRPDIDTPPLQSKDLCDSCSQKVLEYLSQLEMPLDSSRKKKN